MAEEADDEVIPASATTEAPAPSSVPSTPAPPSNLPSMSLDSLIVSPEKMQAVQSDLLKIERAKAATRAAAAAETTRRLDVDRERLNRAYEATAKEPEGLVEWDAAKKSAEHYTDPVAAFGSVGSVFAMLASSFAGLPMEHALNAGAAAINAIHAGDEKAYNREFESWQKNTNLALKRHEILRQNYNDALTLMNSNINAGRTKMELTAMQFDDKKALALLENGMTKELTDLMVSRNKAALELTKRWDEVQLYHDKVTDLRSDPNYQNMETRQKAIADWNERWAPNGSRKLAYDFTKDYLDSQKKANPNWTPDDLAKWRKEAAEAEGDIDTGDGASPKTAAGLKAAEVKRRTAEYVGQGMSQTDAYNKASREVAMTNTTPSGNRVADEKALVDQIQIARDTIAEQKRLLKEYFAVSGIGGALGRGLEKGGNILGLSSNTDRQAFEKNVEKLRLTASRIMTMSKGRPLASEASRINTIVAGKNFGDNDTSTERAMDDLDKLYEQLQKSATSQIGDTWQAPAERPAEKPKTKPGGKNPWEKDPIVKPRAALEPDTSYV